MDINTVMQTPTPRASFALDLDRSVFAAEAAGVCAVGVRHARIATPTRGERSAARLHRARNRACIGLSIDDAVVSDSRVFGTDAPSTAYVVGTGQPVDGKGTRLGSCFWSPPV